MKAESGASPPDVLLVSNGFGETAIATYIAQAIRQQAGAARIEHFPLVGVVQADVWPPAVGPQERMPSGGLVAYWNLRNLVHDLRAGLAGLTLRQYRFLTGQRGRDVIIAVGDIYCLGLTLFAARRPTVFVATAKSDLVAHHSAVELAIARKAAATFVRDELTASSMRAAGVPARFAGNIMMDGLQTTGADLGVIPGALVMTVLPGSRADAPDAAAAQLDRLGAIAAIMAGRGRVVQALFSLAPSVNAKHMYDALRAAGMDMTPPTDVGPVIATGKRDNLEIGLVRGAFADLLHAADIVLGQAGTANEQAAGLGKPVVAAAEHGEAPDKMQWYRMRQKRLLGDALLVLAAEPQSFAAEVVKLIDDSERMQRMTAVGRERMGLPGGAAAVAATALSLVGGAARL